MPRSPSTVRLTGTVATTSRARPDSSGSTSTTECTSVVAPPTSTTTTSPAPGCSGPSPAAASSTAVSTTSGVAPLTIAVKSVRAERCLPPMTWLRNISRIAARAPSGARAPIRGTTFGATTYGTPAASKAATTSSTASTLPASTTGPGHRPFASACAFARRTSAFPPSVPPTSRTTSGSDARRAARSTASYDTCTTRPPLDSATRRPASEVTSSSLPTTAIRSPPPAEEQASTGTSAPSVDGAISARIASQPSSTSVSMVVRWLPVAISAPVPTSTSAAFVNVDPKSTQ